jgi:cyclic 2,3-diphosphoglycerate synthetase
VKALALIDGEHYPDVVRSAFAETTYEVVGAVMLGGTEKLREEADYGVPLYESLEEALEAARPEVVLDLSDEPVLDARRRFRLASRVLAGGLPYVGADFRFDPVDFEPFDRPALGIIGSGKRVGKTAVAGHVARLLSRSREVVVVAMGRGGPPEPVVTEADPTIEDLLALSRSGTHAASDYLEDAALARVVTVGARRCGGGLAGAPFVSNVKAAARVAASLEPDLVLFEGSGAAIPPVQTGRRILVAGAGQDPELVVGYLGAYRLLLSDLVVLTNCEEPLATVDAVRRVRAAIADVNPNLPVIATILRPAPAVPISGRKVAYFTTAPEAIHPRLRSHLEEEQGAEVLLVSGSLSNRQELRSELDSEAARSAEVFLMELKAAAIDVVAEAAAQRGIQIVLCDNEVRTVEGEPDLDEHLVALADAVSRERVPA